MFTFLRPLTLCVVAGTALVVSGSAQQNAPADLVIHNARIFTGDGGKWATAIAITGAESMERQKGTLAAGMFADLAVLSQDIFKVPVENLPRTTSVLTIVGGRVVHDQLGK